MTIFTDCPQIDPARMEAFKAAPRLPFKGQELLGYYNTNRERGATLKASERKCGKQEAAVLAYFQDWSHKWITPEETLRHVFDHHTPLTSVRRAITNLEIRGKLIKSDKPMVMGSYGKMIHCWKFNGQGPRED